MEQYIFHFVSLLSNFFLTAYFVILHNITSGHIIQTILPPHLPHTPKSTTCVIHNAIH